MGTRTDARSYLPLTAAVFHILLSLVDDDRHGYGIAKEVAAATRGQVRFGPGTLYGTLVRMAKAGLVVEVAGSPAHDRRRYFRLTSLGRDVARAEAHRLAGLVSLARGKSLISRSRS